VVSKAPTGGVRPTSSTIRAVGGVRAIIAGAQFNERMQYA
jgi:hypothetical protein